MFWILASASPRRAEILRRCGIRFTVCPADADETITEPMSPRQTVETLSLRKAKAVLEKKDIPKAGEDSPILAADTLVEHGGVLLGKPKSAEDAERMLLSLSGTHHSVYTGMTVLYRGQTETVSVRTDVYFRRLSKEEIRAYVATGEPMDKAGAYGIQGIGSLFVEKIDGDYDNVVGLPVSALYTLFHERFSVPFSEFIG